MVYIETADRSFVLSTNVTDRKAVGERKSSNVKQSGCVFGMYLYFLIDK